MVQLLIRGRTVLGVALSALVLTGCGSADVPATPSLSIPQASSGAGATPLPTSSDAPATPLPTSSSAPPARSPGSSTAPTGSHIAAGPRWQKIGSLTASGPDPLTLSSNSDGYLAREGTAAGAKSWFSKDGRHWQAGTGASPALSCPSVLGICDTWSITSGWEAFAAEPGDGAAPSFWRSTDGTHWVRVKLPADVAPIVTGQAWPAPDGTTLMVLDPTGSGDSTKETLGVLGADGSWRAVDYPSSCPDGPFGLVLPPSPSEPKVWALSDGAKTCVSSDLRQWRTGTFPVTDGFPVTDWVGTPYGIIAIGENSDSFCDRPFQLLSSDAAHWTPIKPALTADQIVDGPAGVIGISTGCNSKPDNIVWKLVP